MQVTNLIIIYCEDFVSVTFYMVVNADCFTKYYSAFGVERNSKTPFLNKNG